MILPSVHAVNQLIVGVVEVTHFLRSSTISFQTENTGYKICHGVPTAACWLSAGRIAVVKGSSGCNRSLFLPWFDGVCVCDRSNQCLMISSIRLLHSELKACSCHRSTELPPGVCLTHTSNSFRRLFQPRGSSVCIHLTTPHPLPYSACEGPTHLAMFHL